MLALKEINQIMAAQEINQIMAAQEMQRRMETIERSNKAIEELNKKPQKKNVHGPQTEGINHINAYSKSATELGKFLSNWAPLSSHVNLPDGKFKTLEGYWFWLKSGNEEFRELMGFQAKQKAKILKIDGDLSPEQQEKFKEATWIKLLSNTSYIAKYHQNPLPIVHYYVFGEKIVPAGPQWWVDYLNKALNLLTGGQSNNKE